MRPDLSIVIPAFNEQDRLGLSIDKILTYISGSGLNAELLDVDDGSDDATAKVAEEACASYPEIASRVIRYENNRGKGFAVKTGLKAAAAETALFSDADLSTPIEEMPKLVDPIRGGEFDVTFGSRALDRSLIGTHQPWRREQGGKVFNLNKFAPLLDLMRIDRFGFDVEFLYVANLHGLRLKEIPVRWNNDDRSKVSVVRDSIRMFDEVRQIRRNAKKGLYNIDK
jgi:dolichyl-phosphate beta-glucosyltransferase